MLALARSPRSMWPWATIVMLTYGLLTVVFVLGLLALKRASLSRTDAMATMIADRVA
jgi:hypothetical protein